MLRSKPAQSSRQLAHIRQLCCLGLGGKAVMPELVKALRDWTPFSSCIFAWAGKDGQLGEVYSPNAWPLETVELYLQRFLDGEGPHYPGFAELLNSEVALYNSSPQREQFMALELYQSCAAPLGIEHVMRVALRDHGRRLGILAMYRPRGRGFSQQDETRMRRVVPYIAHAITTPPAQETEFADSGERGMIVINRRAEIEHMCTQGRHLMWLAAHDAPTARNITFADYTLLLQQLATLRSHLLDIFDGRPAPPPEFRLQNSWGRFLFRAHWMEPTQIGGDALVGISVYRQVPRILKLVDAIRPLPLSPRERETCLWLARGFSQPKIAHSMGVSHNTVMTNVKAIYNKLAITGRDELLAKLL